MRSVNFLYGIAIDSCISFAYSYYDGHFQYRSKKSIGVCLRGFNVTKYSNRHFMICYIM